MNVKKTFSPIGASNHSQAIRAENDFYSTPPFMVEELLKKEQSFQHKILEPCAGEGAIASVLLDHGHDVICYDIDPKTPITDKLIGKIVQKNMFTIDKVPEDMDIIMNPPYKQATEAVRFFLDLIHKNKKCQKLAVFWKIQYLESKTRYQEIFSKYKFLKNVYVSVNRVGCGPVSQMKPDKYGNLNLPSAIAYGWFVWDSSYFGQPMIDWINFN